ncbi:MAG: class I SAM-dependent methyltransferase [Bacteroidetes bacterium]|nr:class I SAM-dependent methyltransferase [Bacteroidota bacterium]
MNEFEEAEFDKYVAHYERMRVKSTGFSGFPTHYFDEYKIKAIANELPNLVMEQISILNFGCGTGKSEPFFYKYFKNATITGIDLSHKSVEYAQAKHHELSDRISFANYDGKKIDLQTKSDIILVANVFHHIDFDLHKSVLNQLMEQLKIGGHLFIFEHNPANPLTRKSVRDCEFDINARLLTPDYTRKILHKAGFQNLKIKFTLFFPGLLRLFVPLEKYMSKLPLGAQYYAHAIK